MTAAFANRPLQIRLDGTELGSRMARCAASAFVRQTLNAPSLAEIAFAEPAKEDISALRFGAELSLQLASNESLFKGEITTIEHERDGAEGHVVRLRAYDKLHRLRKTQRARAFKEMTPADLAKQTVSDLGLDCASAESGPARALTLQYGQSDLEFLAAQAGEAGLYLYLEGDTLRLVTLAGEEEPIELKLGRELARVRSVAGVETMRRSTKAYAWNVARTTVVDASAPTARQDAEDMRSIDLTAFGDIGVRTLFNRVAATPGETKGFAQADIDRAAAGEIVIEGRAEGNPQIRPGRAIRITGVSNDVDGQFTATQALHHFTADGGYVTEFTTAPPQPAARAHGPVFTFGRIVDLADPDRLSRVRVRFPLLGDLESAWMGVLAAGAGKNKGVAVMPENGDTVLVLFPDGDPAYGIVLGGLYGENTAPGQVDNGTRPFVLRTANGQILTLDGENGVARVETSGGDRFELGPSGTQLHATRDLLIAAPGRTVTIRAGNVEFEKA